jgi:hypothetical protein
MVGNLAADHRVGPDDYVGTNSRPWEDHRAGADPASRADGHRLLRGGLYPDREVEVLVAVVLVGDVDVHSGVHVVADVDG